MHKRVLAVTSWLGSTTWGCLVIMSSLPLAACSDRAGRAGNESTTGTAGAASQSSDTNVTPRQPGTLAYNAQEFQATITRRALRDFLDSLPPEQRDDYEVALNQDLQRLYDPTAKTYGPKAFIWSPLELSRYKAPSDFNTPTGRLVALAYVEAATVEAPINAAYTGLKLATGDKTYCVRVRATPATGNRYDWEAWVLDAIGPNHSLCPPNQPLVDSRKLDVDPPQHPDWTGDADYAPVARWGEGRIQGSSSRVAAILVRCGAARCVIGPDGITELSPLHAGNAKLPKSAQVDVDTWFDTQLLGFPPSTGAKPNPTYAASAIPVAGLATITDSMVFNNTFKPVAYVYFKDEPDPASKYALSGLHKGVNTIAIRRVTATQKWEAQITAESGASKVRPVKRHAHDGDYIAPVARWLWMDGDESLWIRCAEGCCEADFF